jgi:hypothetical protein
VLVEAVTEALVGDSLDALEVGLEALLSALEAPLLVVSRVPASEGGSWSPGFTPWTTPVLFPGTCETPASVLDEELVEASCAQTGAALSAAKAAAIAKYFTAILRSMQRHGGARQQTGAAPISSSYAVALANVSNPPSSGQICCRA